MVMFRNPPLDSVAELIRPYLFFLFGIMRPSISVPSLYAETWQLVIVRFSVMRFSPRAYVLLGQEPHRHWVN